MPKVKGPLFSVSARKSLGKALTYQGRPGGAAVYPYKKPKVPLTDGQLLQRQYISWAVDKWQSFSDEVKAEYEAKAKGHGQSGYSLFIKGSPWVEASAGAVFQLGVFQIDTFS